MAEPPVLSPGAGGGAPTPRWRSSARRSSGAFDAVPEGGEASSARVSVVRPSPYAEVLRAARASTCEDPTSPRGGTARLAPPSPAPQRALSPEPQGAAADAQGGEEEEDDYAQDLERLVDAAADDEDTALAAGALESLQGILDYTLRHDDGTASAVAGHVAWVLLGMMGSWTEQLHALPARAPPSAVFAALREQTTEAEAEEVPLEGAQRRASQVLCSAGAARVAAAVLPHLPRAGGAAASAGAGPSAPAPRLLLVAALWRALARGPAANAAAACRAAALPALVTALAAAAGRGAALRSRADAAAPPLRAAAEDAAAEAALLEEVLSAVAAFSCEPRALRGWLARAARAPGARAPLLRALHGALTHQHARAPADVFLLDGESSGLLGLANPKWPFRTGFTFQTWIYLESLAGSDTADAAASALAAASAATAGAKASPAAAAAAAAAAAGEGAAYMPRLFSFLSAEGHGVEAYFHGQYLLIEASGGAGYRATVHFPRALPVRCWAALVVEATATEARLYLDGVLCDVAPLALPAVPLPLAFCCVGTNPPAAMVGLQRRRRQSALFAALGPVYVFREPLGASLIARLAARGADHVPCFGAGAPPRGRAGGYVHGGGNCVSAAEAAALDAELAPKLLQAYHPRLRLAGRAAPDVSPAAPCWTQPAGSTSAGTGRAALQPPGPLLVAGAGRAGGGPPRGATALGGVCTAHRAPLADALWSLGEGGLAALLPLVPPALEGPPGLAPSAGRVGAGGAAAAADAAFAAAAAVRCIAAAAHAHPAALHALARAGAPRALAAALPPLWAAAAAAAPDGDAGVDAAQTAVAEAVAALALAAHAHEPLARQAYATLVLDLRPWHGACRAAQRAVLRAAASAAHAHPAAFRALGGLQRLLDSIARHLAAPPQHGEDDELPSPEREAATSPVSPSLRSADVAAASSAALVDDAFVAAELLCGAGGGDACWRDDMRALVDFTASSAALPPGAPPPGAAPGTGTGIGTSGLIGGAPSMAEAARARPQAARALLLLYRLVSAPAAAARAAALDGLVAANGAELLLVLLRQEACGAAEAPPATPTSPPPAAEGTAADVALSPPNAPPTPSTPASVRARPSFTPAARRARGSAAGAAAELSVSGDIVAGCVRLLAALLAAGRLASRPGGVSPEAALKALRFAFENAPAAFATPGPYEALLRGALGGAAAAALAGGAGGAGGGMLADALAAAMAQRASAASSSSVSGAHGGSALAQPALLRALLPALPFAPPALRRRALRDLLMLCAADAAARAALAALPESPDWLVTLMLCDDDADVPMPPDATQRGEPATTAEAALAFLRVVLEAGLRARGGWRACEAALLSLRAAGAASPHKAPAAAAMAAQLVQGLLAFAAGELRGQTAPEAGAGARAGAALGWAAGTPAAAAAGSAGASASAASAAAATAAAAEARAATVLDTVTENALALLAIAEGALRAATALPESDACDASADDRASSERAAAAFAAYGPDAARVLAGGRERAALAAAAEAEASRAARAAGIPLPEPAASSSQPSDADPAAECADGGLDGIDTDGGGFGSAPGPPPATPGRGATGFIRALTSGGGVAPERASSFDGAADAVAHTLAAAAAAAAEAAAAAAARAGPWGAAGRNARRAASEAEPFAVPAAAPRWRAALGAASELAEELVHGAEKLRRTHPPGGTKPPATTAAAAARTGAALLASDVALLLLLRVALAAMRADAADAATSQDLPILVMALDAPASMTTPLASQLSRREQPLSDAPAPPAAASRHSRLEAVLHRLVAPLLSERPEGPRAVRALAVAAVLYDELWAAARSCGLRPVAPEPALEFRVWRAGLGTASAAAALASFSTATPGSPTSPGGLGTAPSAASEEHLRALVVPFAALLQHWRAALAPALADAAGRAPLASGLQSEDAPFSAAASGGLGAVTLRGASRCAPRDAAALFATPAWAAAFAGRAAAAALLAAASGGGGGGVGLARAFAPPAARARASEAAALRDGHAAAWAAFRRAWGHPDWAAGAGAAVRVGQALSADAPRRAAHAAAAAAAAVAGARAWRRLARRLAEAGVLFAGGPGGGPPSAPDRWRLDETEDALRARRRLKRDYRPGIAEPAASTGAPRPSADGNAAGMAVAESGDADYPDSAQPRASGGAGSARRAPRWSAGGTPSSAHAAPPARRGGGDAHPALDDVAEGAEDAADDAASEHGSRRTSGDPSTRSLRAAPSGRLSATTLASMPQDDDLYDFDADDVAGGGADVAAALARAASDAEAAAAAMRAGLGSSEAPLAVVDVTWVTPAAQVEGVLALTSSRLTFTPAQQQRQDKECAEAASPQSAGALRRPRSWALSALLQIHARRYLLRRSALELFFVDRGAAFFDLGSGAARRSFSRALLGARPPALAAVYADASRASLLRPASALLRPELTARWQRRELSNFEYLMELNTLAGRTYNDVTQWPVFPWVLADYTSPVLDLTNPKTFRDLSKPVGALNPERAQRFRERYSGWDDPVVPPFHYGSHYSSAGTVLYYMLRVEPFTRLAAQLQGGRLDVADRLFFDVKATWDGVLSSMADVKELTPEWFYLPDMFVNTNGVDLGERQTGERLGDVALPPWARDAHDFVAQHRAALESDAVSAQLHRWIDLVFGDKQRGVAAVAAQNVFYYLTYEGAVDVDAIDDPMLLKATQDQIAHFGQTPSQLLQAPHPPRWAASLVKQPLFAAPAAAATYLLPVPSAAAAPALALLASPGGFAVVTPQLQLLRHGLRGARAPDGRGAPFAHVPPALPAPGAAAEAIKAMSGAFWGAAAAFTRGAAAAADAATLASGRPPPPPRAAAPGPRAASAWTPVPGMPSAAAALAEPPAARLVLLTRDGTHLIVGGAADGSLRAFLAVDGALRCVQSAGVHRGPVCALAAAPDGGVMAAASRDGTVTTWLLGAPAAEGGPAAVADGADGERQVAPQELTAAEHAAAATAAAAFAAVAAAEADEDETAEAGSSGEGSPSGAAASVSAEPETDAAVSAAQGAGDAAALALGVAPPPPPLRGPLHFLRGCPEPPAAVAVSCSLDCVAAACPTAGLALFSLLSGRLTRRVAGAPGELLALSREGYAVVWDPRAGGMLRSVSLNGALAAQAAPPGDEGPVAAMLASADGRTLVTGSAPDPAHPGSVGRVTLRALPTLRELYRFAVPEGAAVTALLLLEGDTLLLVATSGGATLVITDPLAPPPRPMWAAQAARQLAKKLPMQYD